MKCLYCDCKIDIINQTYEGLVTGWIPEFYIEGNKIRKNRYNEKLACIADTKQPSGIGIATSKYADEYGINLYENPANPQFTGRITKKIPYLM
ncbi:hypothetical protein P4T31_02500 [Bacillus paramycoides]|nr:hypothetical protein [Bacillus paramycoides]